MDTTLALLNPSTSQWAFAISVKSSSVSHRFQVLRADHFQAMVHESKFETSDLLIDRYGIDEGESGLQKCWGLPTAKFEPRLRFNIKMIFVQGQQPENQTWNPRIEANVVFQTLYLLRVSHGFHILSFMNFTISNLLYMLRSDWPVQNFQEWNPKNTTENVAHFLHLRYFFMHCSGNTWPILDTKKKWLLLCIPPSILTKKTSHCWPPDKPSEREWRWSWGQH